MIRSEQIIEFLGALRKQVTQPLLIIWDGAAIHRIKKLCKWLDTLNGYIAVARLPFYVSELNARNRLKSMQRRPHLITAFWKQAELAF